eukprot:Blabericola_migrator_1__248@NODE_1065_length_5548_cov_186_921182_g732_i0_p9_GENE_NODE_1065_length_5548_cov_186_921182_g732_i0NODE_1065_length_5548_cov_186_921182_g732_i0_p9_ORF_typecomplete_len104_score14_15DPM3/PF08285_11/4_2e12DUF2269/PF10027_9/0_004Wzy_C/PF04932_15/0_0087DUF4131/PF13567_6/0_0087MFS_3/PF05977_13/0_029Claudin_2/PF13903_6/0_09Phage_holin_3_6/PF07332_11/0_16DUF2207/PF09972_9/0_15_NODE_1065_length_5548_cov_186_921182_g732_i010221333
MSSGKLFTPSVPLPTELLHTSRGKCTLALVGLYLVIVLVLYPLSRPLILATLAALIFCGLCCVGIIVLQTQRFNRVPEAERDLKKDIENAKSLLRSRGFVINE